MNDRESRNVRFWYVTVRTGFPSSKSDYEERSCIQSDNIVIARAITAANDRIVVTRIDEEFTIKRLQGRVRRMNFRVRNHSCLLSKIRSDTAPQGILVTASMLPKVKANLLILKRQRRMDMRCKGDVF